MVLLKLMYIAIFFPVYLQCVSFICCSFKIADKCRSVGNYNSVKAILAGLQCTPIYRLKKTWKEVSGRRKK